MSKEQRQVRINSARIPYPEYISIKDWFGSLVIAFPESFLPLLDREDSWMDIAAGIANSPAFKQARVPSPFSVNSMGKKQEFKDWVEWAKAVYILMNGIRY